MGDRLVILLSDWAIRCPVEAHDAALVLKADRLLTVSILWATILVRVGGDCDLRLGVLGQWPRNDGLVMTGTGSDTLFVTLDLDIVVLTMREPSPLAALVKGALITLVVYWLRVACARQGISYGTKCLVWPLTGEGVFDEAHVLRVRKSWVPLRKCSSPLDLPVESSDLIISI